MIRKKGHKVPPQSTASIRELAMKLRSVFNELTEHPKLKIDILEVLEIHLPKIFDNYELEVMEDKVLGDDHGQTFPDKNLIKVRASTYEGALNDVGRDRFTLAHELGHLFLHKNISSFARSTSPNSEIKPFEDSEWQADCFAAEFLMPFDEVKKCTSPLELAYKFGVSPKAAEVRFNKVRSEIERNK